MSKGVRLPRDGGYAECSYLRRKGEAMMAMICMSVIEERVTGASESQAASDRLGATTRSERSSGPRQLESASEMFYLVPYDQADLLTTHGDYCLVLYRQKKDTDIERCVQFEFARMLGQALCLPSASGASSLICQG